MEKLINWILLGPLKGSRSKLGALAAAIVLVLEHTGILAPGSITQNPLVVKLFTLTEGYFLIEHFEKK